MTLRTKPEYMDTEEAVQENEIISHKIMER